MKINEYETAVLGLMLKDQDAAKRITAELDSDKFGTPAHRLIYSSTQNLIIKGIPPDVMTVGKELGQNLETVGGSSYLQSLLTFVRTLELSKGWEQWIVVVDAAGRLRHLGLLVDKYARMYSDFDKLLTEVDDPDEFIATFMQEVNSSLGAIKSQYAPISDAVADLRRRLDVIKEGGIVDLIPSGWPSLEGYFIPRPASYGVIAGLPSMGKSQFAIQLVVGVAIHLHENNLSGHVAFNSLEMPRWRVVNRMACALAGVDSDALDSGQLFGDASFDRYHETLDFIDELPIQIDDSAMITSSALMWNAIAEHNTNQNGARVLGVVDYLQLLRDQNENEELRVSNAIKNQKVVSRDTGSCEISVSPFNNRVMLEDSKVGDLSKCRYSGIFVYDADFGLIVYNPPQMRKRNIDHVPPDGWGKDTMSCVVEKNRDHKVGRIEFNWVCDWTRFSDIALPMGQVYCRNGHGQDDY